ncbi:AsnC family protein [Paenibacillus filicis]|uniref:AsnC family protein n=1 Tax=Paenibacillus filicis TaxID=669464 RepID=A0ABU9DIE4_9BACL
MNNNWVGAGVWAGWRLTTDHPASSYGQPVLVDPDGRSYGPDDVRIKVYNADLARRIGSSPQAIRGRIDRGTLPPYDGVDGAGRSYWFEGTVKDVK